VNYRGILQAMKLTNDEIAQRLKDATATAGPLTPIAPEVERLLGPAQPVADVLAALDRQYKADGKPAVYFLSPDQPLAPHLDELLKPTPDSLNLAGVSAYRRGAYAEAIVHYEEALKLLANHPDQAATTFTTRMNRAAARRELGEVEQARKELRLLAGLNDGDTIPALAKGRARYHLALCQWRLGDRDAAQREAEESLQAYGDASDVAPLKQQTEQLLADLKDNKPLPPLAKVDTVAALEHARVRFRARADLATLPLNQSALPLLDQLLGSARSTKEVFETLDRQYREAGKPAVWFLPLSEPIAPHLDELLK
jgi:tetratricopeptide (TPR) repeat protein